MKTIPIQIERFKTKRGWSERRYTVKTVMPLEALRLCEDMQALKTAIEALRSVLADNTRAGWGLISIDERREAEFELWNEIRVVQKWLRNAEQQMRTRFLIKDENL